MSDDWLQNFNDNLAAAADACPDQMDDLQASQAELAAASVAAEVAREAFAEAHVGVFGAASPHAEWYDHALDVLHVPSLEDVEAVGAVLGGCTASPGIGCGLGVAAAGIIYGRAAKAAVDALKEAEGELKVAEAELKAAQIKNAIALRRAMDCVWHNLMKTP